MPACLLHYSCCPNAMVNLPPRTPAAASGEFPIGRGEVRRRVLVLDDEPLIRWAAAVTLADAGFEVVEASSVSTARRVIDSIRVDLALLDVRLADGDGVELMKEIHQRQPSCRFVMMTALRTPEVAAQVASDVAVLDKPFEMPELLHVVGDMLAQHS